MFKQGNFLKRIKSLFRSYSKYAGCEKTTSFVPKTREITTQMRNDSQLTPAETNQMLGLSHKNFKVATVKLLGGVIMDYCEINGK